MNNAMSFRFLSAGAWLIAIQTTFAALTPYSATDALKGAMAPYRLAAGKYVHAEAMPAEDGAPLPNEVPFLLYTPERPKTGKVPLVVFLPGNGEKGPDLVQQFRQRTIFEKVTGAAFQKRHPCYLLALSPPAAAGTLLDGLPGEPSPVQKLLFGAIEEVAKTRKGPQVDSSRIYLTGLSYGAGGVYGLMTSYPGKFAAGVPVATFPPPAFFAETGRPLRIWHLYNEGDWAASGLSEAQTRPFADAVRAGGGEFRLSTYPATGHNAWDAAWREDPVWDWMFTQGARGDGNGMAHGRIPDPTRRVGGGGEKHAESAESAEIRPPAVRVGVSGRRGRLAAGRMERAGAGPRRGPHGTFGRDAAALQGPRGGFRRRQNVEPRRHGLGQDRRLRLPATHRHPLPAPPPRTPPSRAPRRPRNRGEALRRRRARRR